MRDGGAGQCRHQCRDVAGGVTAHRNGRRSPAAPFQTSLASATIGPTLTTYDSIATPLGLGLPRGRGLHVSTANDTTGTVVMTPLFLKNPTVVIWLMPR